MIPIVTSTCRHKRPPGKRKAVALEVPAIVLASGVTLKLPPETAPAMPANHNRESAIVTVRRKGRTDVPDLSPEELHRRADAGRRDVATDRGEAARVTQ